MAGIGRTRYFLKFLAIGTALAVGSGCQREQQVVRPYKITCSPGMHPAVYRNQPRGVGERCPRLREGSGSGQELPDRRQPETRRPWGLFPDRVMGPRSGQGSFPDARGGSVGAVEAGQEESATGRGGGLIEPGDYRSARAGGWSTAAEEIGNAGVGFTEGRGDGGGDVVVEEGVAALGVYHVGCGDCLEVRVLQLTELGQEQSYRREVDGQGEIALPVLGEVSVAGLTCEQIRQTLVGQLQREYMRDPQVGVAVCQYASKVVEVQGAVGQPGRVYLRADAARLVDVLAQAGAVLETATQVELRRPGKALVATVPVRRLFAREGHSVTPLVRAGDVVRVLGGLSGYVYVTGQVRQPGAKRLRQPFDLLQAVTCAGGVTPVADREKLRVIRRTEGGRARVMVVDLKKISKGEHPNILLSQNDTVIVPVNHGKKFWADLGGLFHRGAYNGAAMGYSAAGGAGVGGAGGVY